MVHNDIERKRTHARIDTRVHTYTETVKLGHLYTSHLSYCVCVLLLRFTMIIIYRNGSIDKCGLVS